MKKTNILIVDDNESQLITLSFILKKKGYCVAMAKDGVEAVKKVKDKFFNLILMDIKMPLMNGVEAFKKIKKVSPGSVVFIITAYAVEVLIKEALDEGVYGILYKPFDIDKMLTLLEKAVG